MAEVRPVADVGRAPVPRLLTGWGRTAPTRAAVIAPDGPAGPGRAGSGDLSGLSGLADAVLASSAVVASGAVAGSRPGPARGLIARGLGRSYGDAAQNAGGTVVDMTALTRVTAIDLAAGTVTAGAGLSLDALMRIVLPLGFFVPVTPGTRYVTLGGALASDIHGKNHHVDGSFSDHVLAFDLMTGTGEIITVTPGGAPDAFAATAGGMGLSGIVTAVTLRLLPVATSRMRVDTERVGGLDELMGRMAARDDDYRYSVAWIDTLARGASMGRAVLTRGDHAAPDELPAKAARDPLRFAPHPRLVAPDVFPSRALNRLSVRAFNELWYRRAPVRHTGLESIATFFHPLDGVGDWNRVYGPRGFVQYQFVVPFGAEETVRTAVTRLSDARCPSFLAVLKRFGPGNGHPLSFPAPGWTLALDIPAGLPGLVGLLDGLDELVAGAGGRVYLSKDSRLRPDLLAAMYPGLDRWRELRAKLDPTGVFVSDLARRLALTTGPAVGPPLAGR